MQGSLFEIALASVAGVIGVFHLAIALVGYWNGVVSPILRVFGFGSGILAFSLGSTSWVVCLFSMSVLIGIHYLQKRRSIKLVST